MGLDIRLPIGLLFLTLGGIVSIEGVLSSADIYIRSAGIDINLYWGLCMLAFGGVMAFLGQRGTNRMGEEMLAHESKSVEALAFEHAAEEREDRPHQSPNQGARPGV